VTTLEPQEIRVWTSFSGRLTAVESAAIKPLVSGTIHQVLFEEGQLVKKGDPLFVIDPRPHQATLQRAEAQLATARSRARLAEDELQRSEEHTSELQSRENLVCRLLLEKKKIKKYYTVREDDGVEMISEELGERGV